MRAKAARLPLNKVLQGDCIEHLNALPEQSVDLIFADPPYNLQLSQELWRPNLTLVDAVTDDWDQFKSFEEYDTFTRDWLAACQRVLKEEGTIWVIGSYHNIFRVGRILMDLGYWILNSTIWIKPNAMPNFRGVRFTNSHEILLWAKKSEDARYTFNYHIMKQFNGGKQMRSEWEIPICSGRERIRVNGTKAHSTQKPEELLKRVILSSSNPGDVVLDPFFGTGTTGAVAKRLQRNWIGIERDPKYVRVARKRIRNAELESLPESPQTRRGLPRIHFSELLRRGLLHEGDCLYFRGNKRKSALVTATGLRHNGVQGSIHQVGRRILDGGPCNGWDYWYFEDENGDLLPIEVLRQKIRFMTEAEQGQER